MITIPTTSQLYTAIISDLEAQLGIQISPIGRVFLRALAGVQAAKLRLFYLGLAFLQKNTFADTADPEALGGTLERFGRVKLNRNPFPAIGGQYSVDVTGTIGATIDAQTQFKSNDDSLNAGKLFILDNAFVMTAATDTITVRALTAGLSAALDIGDRITSTSPIAQVDREGVVTAITVQPQDAETIAVYRRKTVEAYRLEAQGGAGTDYRLWAFDVQGVKTVYPYATSGATNEVDIFVEAENDVSTPIGSGIPPATMLADVLAVINFDPDTSRPLNERGRRPTQVIPNIYAISPLPIDITITGFTGTPADEVLVTDALKAYIETIRPFIDSVDILADSRDTISLNGIIFTIQDAVQGVNWTALELKVSAVVVNSFQFLDGNIPKHQSIVFA